MYVPETDSYKEGYRLLSKLAALMINGMIIFYGVEAILFMGSLDSFAYPLFLDIPIFAFLAILLLIHPLFMLPSLIASIFYIRTNSKGFFVLSIFMNAINLVYESVLFIFFIFPWTIYYIPLIL